jgi:sugar O-acyltransferase (sialic acid O-acetyltransferase NeuD family)
MKKQLIIIGAGNVGGYLAYNITDFPNYEIIGILDDDISKHHQEFYGYEVLGGVEVLSQLELNNISIAICIHQPRIKRGIFEKIKDLDLHFPNFVSPFAWVSKGVNLGVGIIIYPGVSINHESQIGDFVNMNMNCALGHHAQLKDFVSLSPSVSLGGHTTLEEGVDMGIGSSTLQGITIGEYSVIGGKSMVTKDIPAQSKVVGVPGRVIDNGFWE